MPTKRYWSDQYHCTLCGKRFRSYAAEAKHRHNAPLLCKRVPEKRTIEQKDGK